MIITENNIAYDYSPEQDREEFDTFWIGTCQEYCVELYVKDIPNLIKTLQKCYKAHQEYELIASFYRCDDRVCVYSNNLPGCLSWGNNFEHAEEMIKEAFVGCLESYIDSSQEIPFFNPESSPWYSEDGIFIERKTYAVKI